MSSLPHWAALLGRVFLSQTPRKLFFGIVCCACLFLVMLPCFGESPAAGKLSETDPLFEMIPVPAGTFLMGGSGHGDDGQFAEARELPQHSVTLYAYEIGKYPVTNGQFSNVLNYALGKGYLKNANGTPYTTGTLFHGGKPILGVDPNDPNREDFVFYTRPMINFESGVFSPKWRAVAPDGETSMRDHPVGTISWYGAVAFSNWLNEMEGLTPCYDLTKWELIDADPITFGLQFCNGYRLPTEAEWIRAAGWDGTKLWAYGITQDTLNYPDDAARANFRHLTNEGVAIVINPLGLIEHPYTSPVGWFNGINVSPNGGIQTIDSKSPIGAYDMCGNVREWVYDWSSETYYGESAGAVNPTGPTSGTIKAMHGGSYDVDKQHTRVNNRDGDLPEYHFSICGMRLARSLHVTRAATWTEFE